MGKKNENRDYRMQGVILERVTQEKDLGVGIDTGGKQVAQRQAAIGNANRVLGCIRRGINYKSKEVVLTLCRNLVRAISRLLCTILVTTTQEERSCHAVFSVRLLLRKPSQCRALNQSNRFGDGS